MNNRFNYSDSDQFNSGYAPSRNNLRDLSREQINFENEFDSWDRGFSEWKANYSNHPDKRLILSYEQKFLEIRDRLVARRAELNMKYSNRLSSPRERSLNADLNCASAAADSILAQFGGGQWSQNSRPSRFEMLSQPPIPSNRPHPYMRNQRQLPNRFSNHQQQKIMKPLQRPKTTEELMIEHRERLERVKLKAYPKNPSKTAMARKDAIMKRDESTWTEEEKLFIEVCDYIKEKRQKASRERYEKQQAEAAAASMNVDQKTETAVTDWLADETFDKDVALI